jgi:NitT/TauT family transport system ATP-binding protein
MISLQKVSISYGHRQGPASAVLRDISLNIDEGEFVCVLGPSGCGKTTLLNLIAGFIYPSQGSVIFEDKEVQGPGPERGVVFQDATLFPWLSVLKNVEFGLKLQGFKGSHLRQTALNYIKNMGLAGHEKKFPYALSGGMRQRVAIARVLALDPKVLLLDEPFSALDANTRERLQDELLRVWMAQRRTVLYVTHSVEEATYLGERIIILGDAACGIFADMCCLLKRPRNRSSPEFLAMKETLRSCLAEQPCCIQPSLRAGGKH